MKVNTVLKKKNTVLTEVNRVLTKENTGLTKVNTVLAKENTVLTKVNKYGGRKRCNLMRVWPSSRVVGYNHEGCRFESRWCCF